MLAIAYQVYLVGLSFDKTCLLMNFFQNLHLRKSQAESLMKRLARRWEEEFDVLCMLLANSLVACTTSNPPMIPATPESELELGMQILFGFTTDLIRTIARHAYWPSLLAVPCVIVPLAFMAKGSDQAAEHVACCPTQAGFVN